MIIYARNNFHDTEFFALCLATQEHQIKVTNHPLKSLTYYTYMPPHAQYNTTNMVTNTTWNSTKIAGIFFTFIIGTLLFLSCEKPDEVISIDIDEFTPEHQVTIGKHMKERMLEMPTVYPLLGKNSHECAYERPEELFRTLVNTATIQNRKTFNWELHIIENEDIQNAFTLPGGYVFIYTGLLKFAKTESELLAILGSEIVYADKEYTLNTLKASYGKLVLSDLSLGKKVPTLTEIVTDLPLVEYEEEVVLQADSILLSIICPFRYDAAGLQNFVEQATAANIDWINSKKGAVDQRILQMKELTIYCGHSEATFEERYQSFLTECL